MWLFRQVFGYIGFLVRAKTTAQIHSPYLFVLLQFIHDPARRYYIFNQIEKFRDQFLHRKDQIGREDHGAGSRFKNNRTIRQIVKSAVSPASKCQLIFRLLVAEKPRTILELGTSLGIMTAYLATADRSAQVHTIEGDPALADIAGSLAQALDCTNITCHTGIFSEILPSLLPALPMLDFVLIDGDHRGASLKDYYKVIQSRLSASAIVMVDDIRWSGDMFAAWQEILQDEAVTASLDYYSFGLLFFRQDFVEPIHLQIRPQSISGNLLPCG